MLVIKDAGLDETKDHYVIETKGMLVKSHSLTRVMLVWAQNRFHFDNYELTTIQAISHVRGIVTIRIMG